MEFDFPSIDGLPEFYSFIRYIIVNCPVASLLALNFAVLLVFSMAKRLGHKGGD